MDAFGDFEKTAQEEITRVVTADDKNYTVTRKDPYGYYVITTKGPLPDPLKGNWTSHLMASKAIERYTNGQRTT